MIFRFCKNNVIVLSNFKKKSNLACCLRLVDVTFLVGNKILKALIRGHPVTEWTRVYSLDSVHLQLKTRTLLPYTLLSQLNIAIAIEVKTPLT